MIDFERTIRLAVVCLCVLTGGRSQDRRQVITAEQLFRNSDSRGSSTNNNSDDNDWRFNVGVASTTTTVQPNWWNNPMIQSSPVYPQGQFPIASSYAPPATTHFPFIKKPQAPVQFPSPSTTSAASSVSTAPVDQDFPFRVARPIPSNAAQSVDYPSTRPATADSQFAFPAPAAPIQPAVASDPQDQQRTYTSAPFNQRTADDIALIVLRFAHDVVDQQLVESDNNGNKKCEIFSPVSVMSALSLLTLAARGKSYQQLEQLLGLSSGVDATQFHREFGLMLEDIQLPVQPQNANIGGSANVVAPQQRRQREQTPWRFTSAGSNIRGGSGDRDKSYEHTVHLANGLFAQADYELNQAYVRTARSIYHSRLMRLDFQSQAHASSEYVNAWVRNNTYGKIPKIVSDDFPAETNVVLANALYFKGFWESSFFEAATNLDNFYPHGTQQAPIKVQMMATGGVFPYYDSLENDCRIIGLPYKGNQTTMYIIQPHQSSRARLQQLHQSLNEHRIEEMIAKMEQKSALVALPKMHFQKSLNVKKVLLAMGVRDIFRKGQSDLSLMVRPNSAANRQQASQQPFVTDFINSRLSDIDEQNSSEGQRVTRRSNVSLMDRLERQLRNLNQLEKQRSEFLPSAKADLFVADILHQVDIEVNEQGTEAAAATLTYLRRSGTSVLFRADAPFMMLIRHDPTKLMLFYGVINEPELS